MYASLKLGLGSHKQVDNAVLKFYYWKVRAHLFALCPARSCTRIERVARALCSRCSSSRARAPSSGTFRCTLPTSCRPTKSCRYAQGVDPNASVMIRDGQPPMRATRFLLRSAGGADGHAAHLRVQAVLQHRAGLRGGFLHPQERRRGQAAIARGRVNRKLGGSGPHLAVLLGHISRAAWRGCPGCAAEENLRGRLVWSCAVASGGEMCICACCAHTMSDFVLAWEDNSDPGGPESP
eukprot:3621103-Prymnesium_polylepis.1